ncbi:MAG: hypothetical protein KGK33_15835 [Hyphomicrobiales bacterium]|nr:hypothetical protein [Hyphomicrobiales bacterium]MDE2286081.1 hypothetical protein [Hyphomicrobiales bacterium]MDE2373023.1 hypothetical protein [Hyphomicrobiales bacterium]
MSRYLMTFAVATVALSAGSVVARAGPCTADIDQTERRIHQAQAAGDPGQVGAPSGPQSVGAQLHHQPTPSSVDGAETKARDAAAAAIERARAADAAGDAAACERALADAKALYGLQ